MRGSAEAGGSLLLLRPLYSGEATPSSRVVDSRGVTSPSRKRGDAMTNEGRYFVASFIVRRYRLRREVMRRGLGEGAISPPETLGANEPLVPRATFGFRMIMFGTLTLSLLALAAGAIWLTASKADRSSSDTSKATGDSPAVQPSKDQRVVPQFPPIRPVQYAEFSAITAETSGSRPSERPPAAVEIPRNVRNSGPASARLVHKGGEAFARLASNMSPALAQKFSVGSVSCFRDGCLTEIEARGADMDSLRELNEWSEEPLKDWGGPVFRGAPLERNGRLFLTWILLAPKEDGR